MPTVNGKYRNPTLEDFINVARKRMVMSDGDSLVICMLAEEVIKLRNEMPCPNCLGHHPRTNCRHCKGHVGKKYKPMKRLIEGE